MKCPHCGAATLVHDTRYLPYTCKSEATTIPAVTADWCPTCGEAVMALDESQRVSQAMLEFNKQVSAGLAALKQAGQALDDQLANRGVDPETIVAEFKQARKSGRGPQGDPHDKKTR